MSTRAFALGWCRIGAGRLQHIANILRVSSTVFFEGSPGQAKLNGNVPELARLSEFMKDADSRALAKAMLQFKDSGVRRRIVDLVEQLAYVPNVSPVKNLGRTKIQPLSKYCG